MILILFHRSFTVTQFFGSFFQWGSWSLVGETKFNIFALIEFETFSQVNDFENKIKRYIFWLVLRSLSWFDIWWNLWCIVIFVQKKDRFGVEGRPRWSWGSECVPFRRELLRTMIILTFINQSIAKILLFQWFLIN